VLNQAGKDALQARSPHNIVTIDLPHFPPKEAAADGVYEQANLTLQSWLKSGVLARDPRPALYPYTQSYQHNQRTFHRRGVIALVRLSPFGKGEVVPHEKTYKGPIEDRMKLMRATGMQLSPIFGLFSDPRHELTDALYRDLSRPEFSGTLDGVRSDLWHVNDAGTVNQVIDLMEDRPVYIADGHHRYTTALQYQQECIAKAGGSLPPNHPANYCMFVLVGMQDPGLLILPTHRLLGGLPGFSIARLQAALGDNAAIEPTTLPAKATAELEALVAHQPPHTFGLYDGLSGQSYLVRLRNSDVLAALEPGQSSTWRELDVAILQRYLIDEVIRPTFCPAAEPARGYTADGAEVAAQVDGQAYQIGLVLQSTPLHALEALGKHNEVMPQKSTYFFPKLATGMVINPLT
jgi:uncharacterized protein (DUF1015 family)